MKWPEMVHHSYLSTVWVPAVRTGNSRSHCFLNITGRLLQTCADTGNRINLYNDITSTW
jgi:hypothetical protein